MLARLAPLAILLLTAAPAAAEDVYCHDGGHFDWQGGAIVADGENFVPVVFRIDLDTGDYDEHRRGSRAWITGGGTLRVVHRGDSAARQDFVGVDESDGSTIRFMAWHDDKPFVRMDHEGVVGYGLCNLAGLMDLDQ